LFTSVARTVTSALAPAVIEAGAVSSSVTIFVPVLTGPSQPSTSVPETRFQVRPPPSVATLPAKAKLVSGSVPAAKVSCPSTKSGFPGDVPSMRF
jgi:hypothetical protein